MKNPLGANYIGIRGTRDKVPSIVRVKSLNLGFHSSSPIWITKSLSVGTRKRGELKRLRGEIKELPRFGDTVYRPGNHMIEFGGGEEGFLGEGKPGGGPKAEGLDDEEEELEAAAMDGDRAAGAAPRTGDAAGAASLGETGGAVSRGEEGSAGDEAMTGSTAG